jgi:integrase
MPEHLKAFRAVAPERLWQALVLAIETGQRQGDLIRLPWSAYDGQWIRLRQSKGGQRVQVPVTQDLKAILDAILACHFDIERRAAMDERRPAHVLAPRIARGRHRGYHLS